MEASSVPVLEFPPRRSCRPDPPRYRRVWPLAPAATWVRGHL